MRKVITVGPDGTIDTKEFMGMLDIRCIKYYSIKQNKDKTLTLKFYDKNRKLVKPNAS